MDTSRQQEGSIEGGHSARYVHSAPADHLISVEDQARARIGISPFDAFYTLMFTDMDQGTIRAEVNVDQRHAQITGVVHGGIYAAIAESMASFGTNWAVSPGRQVGMGLSNSTNFLRPTPVPVTLVATGTALHTGRRTWVWDIDIRAKGAAKPSAVSRMVIAVVPDPGAGEP